MTDVQIKSQTIEFACVPWEVYGPTIKPIPGTWTLPPHVLRDVFRSSTKEVVGLISCPHCGVAAMITADIITVNKVERSASLELFRCAACPLACKAVFLDWDKRKLYCVAYEIQEKDGTLKAEKEYYHAVDQKDAMDQFIAGHKGDPILNIAGVAPVIGYFINDNKGDKLSV